MALWVQQPTGRQDHAVCTEYIAMSNISYNDRQLATFIISAPLALRCSGYGIGLVIERSRVWHPAVVLPLALRESCSHPCASVKKQFGTGQEAVMLCAWEGNHRSGVALAMHHRLTGLSTYGLNGQCAGDEHPPPYCRMQNITLYFFLTTVLTLLAWHQEGHLTWKKTYCKRFSVR